MNTKQANRRRFIRISAASAVATLCPVSSLRSEMASYQWSGTALGAHTSLNIVHADRNAAAALALAAREEIERLERIFSLYRDDSLLVKLNSDGVMVAPPAELLSLFSIVDGIHRRTNGSFDPTVQPVWHSEMNKIEGNVAKLMTVGSETLPTSLRNTWKDVQFNSKRVRFAKPDMSITLNGIAQGFISQQVSQLLRKHGMHNVLVNVGEIVALGKRVDERAWQVGIAELETGDVEETIELSNCAVATSSPLNPLFPTNSISGHIIDPATSAPCLSVWRRLSVIHPSASIADGLSTGLLMHTAKSIKSILREFPQARVIAIGVSGDRLDITAPMAAI